MKSIRDPYAPQVSKQEPSNHLPLEAVKILKKAASVADPHLRRIAVEHANTQVRYLFPEFYR